MKATSISVSVLYTISHSDEEGNHVQDCTNGGVTGNTAKMFLLFADRESYDSYIDALSERDMHGDEAMIERCRTNALIVVHRTTQGTRYTHCEPAVRPKGLMGPMAGGNFVYTSDSRYKEVTDGVWYPISVHDRFESSEQYASYD